MRLLLFIIFVCVPLIEIGLFIQVGDMIGLWPTILVVVLTAIAGTALLRHQGLSALSRLQDSLNAGVAPLDPVFDGLVLLVAGLLLLTPGFFTDSIGFLLFVPYIRLILKRAVAGRISVHRQMHGQNYTHTSDPGPHGPHGPHGTGGPNDIIDADYTDVTDTPSNPDTDPKSDRPRLD